MPNPYTDAQGQAATNGFGYTPQPPAADMTGAGGPPTGGMASPQPQYFGGSMGEIGQLRDAIMAQFPSVNNVTSPDDADFTPGQSMGLMALAIANPQGALDFVREKKKRQLQRQLAAQQFNLHALELAGHVVDAQNNMNLGIAKLHQSEAQMKQNMDIARMEHQAQMAGVGVQQAQQDLLRHREDRYAQGQDMATGLLTQGTDQNGQPISAMPSAPNFTSNASQMGLVPSFDENGLSLGQPKADAQPNSVAFRQAAATELAARKSQGRAVDPQFAGLSDGDLLNIVAPTTDRATLRARRALGIGTATMTPATPAAPRSMLPGGGSAIEGEEAASW